MRIALFNHKGGVGKTTLTVNIADALSDLGKRVLIVDADPQCNLTAFYLPEKELDQLLHDTAQDGDDENGGDTVWSAVKPVSRGKGDVKEIQVQALYNNVMLACGDVLLAEYEEELALAWSETFARKSATRRTSFCTTSVPTSDRSTGPCCSTATTSSRRLPLTCSRFAR
jgi:cellulose biosynthesis protein BcsQ